MKIISYSGTEGSVIVIERPEDLFPALDWMQTQMVDLSERGDGKAEKCANFISYLMDLTEQNNFGNYDDIDKIEY